MTPLLRSCALTLLFTSVIAATPRPLPHHPGNVFVAGENVRLTRAPIQIAGWKLIDYDGRTISESKYGAEAIDFGKLPVGYYELRSGAGRETLAVIAYKQPITAPEITEIRGSNASGVLNTLIGRKLIKIVGRKAVVGRPCMYSTTRDFLDKFGLNDISDLPKVDELSDALGFDLPAGLAEPTVTTSPLPFDEALPAAQDDPAQNDAARNEETSEHAETQPATKL